MFVACFFGTAVHAQINTAMFPSGGTFPLALVLEGGHHAASIGGWQPNWPFELPPDAFTLLSGEISRISIEGEGHSLTLAFNSCGFIEEFPFMLGGEMTQVSFVYNSAMEIQEVTITFPSDEENPWRVEVLERMDSLPTLVRAFRVNAWYFIFITRGFDEIREAWHDVEGNLIGAYRFPLAVIAQDRRIMAIEDFSSPQENAEFHFDSRGLITDIYDTSGFFRALYFREDLVRFWERRPLASDPLGTGNFSFQWDANGLLLRLTGGSQINFEYEYTFDERGNWIERREIRMIRALGHFVPTPGTVFRRTLEYRSGP